MEENDTLDELLIKICEKKFPHNKRDDLSQLDFKLYLPFPETSFFDRETYTKEDGKKKVMEIISFNSDDQSTKIYLKGPDYSAKSKKIVLYNACHTPIFCEIEYEVNSSYVQR